MGGRTGVEHCSSNLEYKIKKYFKNYSTLSLVYSDNGIIYPHENAQENLNFVRHVTRYDLSFSVLDDQRHPLFPPHATIKVGKLRTKALFVAHRIGSGRKLRCHPP
jgi:hypothetical protein